MRVVGRRMEVIRVVVNHDLAAFPVLWPDGVGFGDDVLGLPVRALHERLVLDDLALLPGLPRDVAALDHVAAIHRRSEQERGMHPSGISRGALRG